MNVLQIIVLTVIGMAGGGMVSAGVFALITSTGVMTRFAEITHTAKYVQQYENAVVFSAILFNLFWVFEVELPAFDQIAGPFLAIMGLCQGIFIGCLAVSLAEALNATAIFARRMRLGTGLSFIVLSIAIGKAMGALVHFFAIY